jgi:DNA helicase-2/ATP-dependent DNA helicase PcrA
LLYRVNFRSEDYEEALAAARIPYQVKDGAFLHRQTGRQMLSSLKRVSTTEVADTVRRIADRGGFIEELPDGLGEQELTRQNDLARFVRLAEEFDDGEATAAGFVADIEARFGTEGEGRGVNLLTYHRAKGLEFEAVFLPRLEDGELPFRRSKSNESVAEERRLFYVGITRAKTYLAISWVNEGRRRGSPFIGEVAPKPPERAKATPGSSIRREPPREEIAAQVGAELALSGGFRGRVIAVGEESVTVELDVGGTLDVAFGERVSSEGRTLPLGPPAGSSPEAGELLDALKRWRRARAKQDGVPAYVIFHDSTLEEMVRRCPESPEALSRVGGVGPVKIERYGAEILALISKS